MGLYGQTLNSCDQPPDHHYGKLPQKSYVWLPPTQCKQSPYHRYRQRQILDNQQSLNRYGQHSQNSYAESSLRFNDQPQYNPSAAVYLTIAKYSCVAEFTGQPDGIDREEKCAASNGESRFLGELDFENRKRDWDDEDSGDGPNDPRSGEEKKKRKKDSQSVEPQMQ